MWRNFVQPSEIIGEVEAIKANVISSQDGTLASIAVDRFQFVTNGEVLAVVNVADQQFLDASMATIAADLKLMQARMNLDKTRNFDAYVRKHEDLLAEKMALNLAKIRLAQTESELKRMKTLYGEGVVSEGSLYSPGVAGRNEFGLDVAKRDHEQVLSEIESRSNLVEHLEAALKEMDSGGLVKITPDEKAITEAIKAQQDQLKAEQKPCLLKAPISGVVSLVLKSPGERIVRGEPIIVISSPTAQRVVGYVRQPVQNLPTTNDTVVVRTRTLKRQAGEGQILKVGAQYEAINPVLLPDPTRVQMGFPILVSLPQGMNVSPGN